MEDAVLRMAMYRHHIAHAKNWGYAPLNWHTWKFKVWPEYDPEDGFDGGSINKYAADLATKKRVI